MFHDCACVVRPRILIASTMLVAAGFFVATPFPFSLARFAALLTGSGLIACGCNLFNQVLEAGVDRSMSRTENRPFACGRWPAGFGTICGLLISAGGALILYLSCGVVCAGVGLCTLVVYVCGYTPAKTRTLLSLPIGAVSGACPPLIGWAGAGSFIGFDALAFFSLFFIWQFPHVMSIAGLHQDEYADAGVLIPDGAVRAKVAVWFCVFLVASSVLVWLSGLGSWPVAVVVGGAALAYLFVSVAFSAAEHSISCRRLLSGSLIYVIVVVTALVGDRALSSSVLKSSSVQSVASTVKISGLER